MTDPLTRDERSAALYLLRLAREYIVKGCEQHAYDGCALSGDTVLRRLDAGLEALAWRTEQPAPTAQVTRNELVQVFLATPEKYTHLLMMDGPSEVQP